MRTLQFSLLSLACVLLFNSGEAQSSGGATSSPTPKNTDKAKPQPKAPAKPKPKPPAKPKPKPKPTPKSGDDGKSTKKLLGVQPLPVFCVKNFASPQRKIGKACAEGEFESRTGNAKELAKALSDDDFSLVVLGDDKIVVYCKNAKGCDAGAIDRLRSQLEQQAEPALAFKKTLAVPKGLAAPIAGQVSSLNGAGITADPLGNSTIQLKSQRVPSREDFAELKEKIRQLGWERDSVSPALRVFELDASTVAKQLAPAAGGSKDSSSDSGDNAKGGKDKNAGTDSGTPQVQVNVNSGTAKDDSSADDSADSSADDNASKSDSGKKSDDKKADTGSGGGSAAPNVQSVADMLVFSNSDGSDKGIRERQRLMAMLDLPRPEVLMNVWSFQASSGDPNLVKKEFEGIRQTVAEHNEALQNAIQYGWDYLSRSMVCEPATKCDAAGRNLEFFDKDFYNYITQRFVNDCAGCTKELFNICPDGQYCLGYGHAFDPVRPTLTNILLTMIASKDPLKTALTTALCMEGYWDKAKPAATCFPYRAPIEKAINSAYSASPPEGLKITTKEKLREKKKTEESDIADCIKSQYLDQKSSHFDCELEDRIALYVQLKKDEPETLQLSCFKSQIAQSLLSTNDFTTLRREQVERLAEVDVDSFLDSLRKQLQENNATKPSEQLPLEHDKSYSTTRLGLVRAAIADFLFNYKMATQYPHDFVAYDLNQSAQELNAQLNPLIVAFNRDVAAFTEHLEAELSCKYPNDKNWFKGLFTKQKNTFRNDGEVTVRGISGVESVVNTVTQSFFDATKPPNLTDLISSVSDAEGKLPAVLKSNLSANEAAVIVGALNSVKPAQAKIGREFDVDITPHTLAGASSAELDVKLTVQDSADPTLFTADKSSEDNISRVGKHNTTTKVRVDSLKLFEVSSFSALLQRPKSKIPIVPPLFEVPYFGSFIGLPIPGAKEYHRSTAIVSAVIVPTAFDLAYGIDFTGDRVCETVTNAAYPEGPKYECHKAVALGDLHRLPIRNFHKKIVECFASNSRCPAGAGKISFTNVPPTD